MAGESVYQAKIVLGLDTSRVNAEIERVREKLRSIKGERGALGDTLRAEDAIANRQGIRGNTVISTLQGGLPSAVALDKSLLMSSVAMANLGRAAQVEANTLARLTALTKPQDRNQAGKVVGPGGPLTELDVRSASLRAQASQTAALEAGNREYLVAQTQLTASSRLLNANQKLVALEIERRALSGEQATGLGAGTDSARAVALARRAQAAEARLAQAQLSANIDNRFGAGDKTALAGNQAYLEAQAEATAAARLLAANEKLASSALERLALSTGTDAAIGTGGATLRQALAAEAVIEQEKLADSVRQRTISAERSTIQARMLAQDEAALAAIAQQTVAERELTLALNRRTQTALRASALDSEATAFQRLQQRLGARTGGTRLAGDYPTAGQFFGKKLETTLGFGLSGLAVYGAFAGIKEATKEAKALQTNLALVKEQLTQFGRGDEFESLSANILKTARNTGIAASELAFLALQLRGAFADSPGARGGIGFINTQLEQAGKLARVTGLPLKEITDSGTALAKTFDTTFGHIGDVTIRLQQRFGVLAKEIITAAADIAPAAKEAGASFNELASVVAVIQRSSGRAGTSIAEALGRILPAIQENALPLLDAYGQLSEGSKKFADSQEEIVRAIGRGNTFDVFKRIIRDFDEIARLRPDVAQSIISALGGRREAATLSALFGDTKAFLKALDDLNKGGGKNNLNEQFQALQGTVTQAFAEMKQSANQFINAILNSGLLDFFQSLAEVLQGVFNILGRMVGIAGEFTNFLQLGGDIPWVSKLLQFFLIYKAFQVFAGRQAAAGVASGVLSGASGAAPAGVNPYGSGVVAAGMQRAATEQIQTAKLVDVSRGSFLVSEGKTIGTQIYNTTKAGVTGFFKSISAKVNSLTTGQRLGIAGAGIGLSLIGNEIGGTAGGDISALGTGLTLGVVAHPVVGAVVAATQIISNHLRAAQQAKEDEDKLVAQFVDVASTSAGRKDLRSYLDETKDKGGVIPSGVIPGLDAPQESTTRAKAAKKALDEYTVKTLTTRLKNIRDTLGSDKDSKFYKTQIDQVVKVSNDPDQTNQAENIRIYFKRIQDYIKKGIIKGNAVKHALDKGNAAILAAVREGTRTDVEQANLGTLSNLKSEYQAGNIGYGTYISRLQKNRGELQNLLRNAKGGISKELAKQLVETDRALNSGVSDYITAQVDFMESMREIGGSGELYSPADIAKLETALSTPGFADEGARHSILLKGIAATRAALQDEINRQTDDAAKLAVGLAGRPLAEPFRLEAIREYLHLALQAAKGVTENLEKAATAGDTSVPDLENKAIQLSQFLGITYVEAFKIVIEGMIKALRKRLAFLRGVQIVAKLTMGHIDKQIRDRIEGIKKELTPLVEALKAFANIDFEIPNFDPGNVGVNTGSLESNAAGDTEDLTKRIALAKAAYEEALVALDPVAAAQAAIRTAQISVAFAENEAEFWEAQAQLVRAEQQLVEAQRNILSLQNSLLQAQANGDPVEIARLILENSYRLLISARSDTESLQAQIDFINARNAYFTALGQHAQLQNQLLQAQTNDPIQQAKLQLVAAVGGLLGALNETAALQAQIDIISAQKTLQNAMVAIIDSQISLAQAIATAAGETVTAASEALRKAQYDLAQAQSTGQGEAAINNLKAQVIQQQASLRDTILADKEGTIDFNLQVQKISTQQAISQYEALLSQADILGLTEQQRRDLILKIQNLKHSLDQDLQFDLPSDLRLPTLYESRRLAQSGGNYQDNRQITLTLNSTDPQSTINAFNALVDELNSQPVYGAQGRIY